MLFHQLQKISCLKKKIIELVLPNSYMKINDKVFFRGFKNLRLFRIQLRGRVVTLICVKGASSILAFRPIFRTHKKRKFNPCIPIVYSAIQLFCAKAYKQWQNRDFIIFRNKIQNILNSSSTSVIIFPRSFLTSQQSVLCFFVSF